MELISKLEKIVLGWARNVPHLPTVGRRWLGANVWWIAAIGTVITGIAVLVSLARIFTLISLIGAPSSAYYVLGSNYVSLALVGALISFVFLVANGVLLAAAVKPLQNMQKKGWVLLFMTLLVATISVVVRAVLSFSVVGFIIGIIFGAVGVVIGAYFLFEIHDQFGHRAIKAKPVSIEKDEQL
ncbi:MAG: hypothetical protein EOT05_04095 [Candidatus Microsaccharimonas sossegonensis]|uniref:Uncharacterized protein n=1 Tax=Candidatus Microsaccharimonas sossegonensis TaxID=2506948 RepID=A0A4Q0AJP2_9BACT|nr:MAG: hypothetical protein EOT05_04095 [Candidatus Microsaccharimonas sossegonensis]